MSKGISKKSAIKLGVVAIVSIGIFLISTFSVNAKNVTAWIESKAPIGSTKEAVISFCDRKGIGHSEIDYDKDHTINASISMAWFWPIDGGVYVVFYFDENNKLVRYKVDESYTFL